MDLDTSLLKRFTARPTTVPNPEKKYWDTLVVEVFETTLVEGEGVGSEKTTKLGEYKRNYPAFYSTFFPFELKGKYYALYSPDYTGTRILSLPDLKDLGGEDRNTFGFCPVAYVVPLVTVRRGLPDPGDPYPYNPRHDPERWAKIPLENEPNRYRYEYPKESEESPYREAVLKFEREHKEWDARHPYETVPATFGFVAGCVWGDDSSWKVQYLDLSRADEGILVREDRLGYVELLGGSDTLASSIDAESYEDDYPVVSIAVRTSFDLRRHLGNEEREAYRRKKEVEEGKKEESNGSSP